MICFMDSKIIVWTFLHFATSSKIGVSPVSSEIILTASRVISAHQQKFIEVTCTTLHVSTANFKIYYTSNGSTNLKSCIKVTSCVIGLHRLYDLKQAYECKVMMTIGNLSKTTIAENLLPRTETEKSTSTTIAETLLPRTETEKSTSTTIADTLLPRTETDKSTSSDELLRENLKWIIAGVTIICVAATVSVAYGCGRMGKRYYDKIQRENRRQCTRKSSAYDVVELPEFPKTRPEKVQSVVTPRIDQRS
ncbi:uncharacterized protein LOC128235348 [Mya arenaria]|uniref:uncharacterized protein LOC128235348 n=1 Tax=Mya arenaria TaxID=6604 RepID=UPI0022E0F6D3|nr:uncharacterized protein LOC128235348 [Mya arenaria]